MGRVKLKIKRLESNSNRQVTYSKRKTGILKKAEELSILCDIEILLLMFSPAGKPAVFHGQRSNFEKVVAQFAQLPPQERAKRKLESLEVLRKTFKKLDHDVNVEDFLGSSKQTVEELREAVKILQNQLMGTLSRLSCWNNIEQIDSMEDLTLMQDSLRNSINQIRLRKENLEKQRIMSLECSTSGVLSRLSEFQKGIENIPVVLSALPDPEQLQLPWYPNNENQQMIWPDDPALFQQRDVSKCSIDNSAPVNPLYYGQGVANQIENMIQNCYNLNDVTASCLGIQPGEQYAYNNNNNQNQYGCTSIQEANKMMIPEPTGINNFQGNTLNYDQIHNNNFQGNTLSHDQIQNNSFQGNTLNHDQIHNNNFQGNLLNHDQIQNNNFQGNTLNHDQIQNNNFQGNLLNHDQIHNNNFQGNLLNNDQIQNNNFDLPSTMYNNNIGWLPPPAGSCSIPVFNENSYPQNIPEEFFPDRKIVEEFFPDQKIVEEFFPKQNMDVDFFPSQKMDEDSSSDQNIDEEFIQSVLNTNPTNDTEFTYLEDSLLSEDSFNSTATLNRRMTGIVIRSPPRDEMAPHVRVPVPHSSQAASSTKYAARDKGKGIAYE